MQCDHSPDVEQGVFPSPAVLVAYGLENSNKTNVITSVLEKREYQYAVIRSRECLSPRHLLSKIFAEVIEAFGLESQLGRYVRVDSLNALLENMRKISRDTCGRRFVVVIEDIDRLKQAGTMLLPALARLGDQVRGISILLNGMTWLTWLTDSWVFGHNDIQFSATSDITQNGNSICPFSSLHAQ